MKNLRLQLLLTIGMFLVGTTEVLSQSHKYQSGCDITASNISYETVVDTITQVTASIIKIGNRDEYKKYIFFNSAEERNLNDEEFFEHRFFSHNPYTFYQAMRDYLTYPILDLDRIFIKPLNGRETFQIVIEGVDNTDDFIQNTLRIITEEQLRSHKKLHFIPDMDDCWAYYRHNTLLIPKDAYQTVLLK